MKYAFQTEEGTAKTAGTDLEISTKQAIEVANFIRGKNTKKIIFYLEDVMKKKKAIPYKRFTNGAGHKSGMGPGKFPIKTAQTFIKLIKLAEANATNKGLGEELVIKNIVINKASTPNKYGRQTRRKTKRTHIQILLKEVESKKSALKPKTTKVKKQEITKPDREQDSQEDTVSSKQDKTTKETSTKSKTEQKPDSKSKQEKPKEEKL